MTSVAAETTTTAEGSRRLYEYEPFGDGRTIRVLTLHPALSPDEPLSGALTMESLEEAAAAESPETDAGGFEAVSYVWGSRKRTHELRCGDDRVLPITQSIADALLRLRRDAGGRPRRLWADQVCINQGDVVERSQQVNLMNSVYRSARRVLVWLGRDKEGKAGEAVAMVQHLQEVFADEQAHQEFRKAHSENLHLQDAAPWRPFAKLAMLPWFNRIWIVQEIGTRTPATLFWGEAQISWDVLSSVVAVLNERYHHLRARFTVMTPNIRYLHRRFEEPDELIAAHQRHRRGNIVYELHRARHMLAEDPRDRVFAFLGHFSLRKPGTTPALRGLVADYSRSVEDVYCDVAIRGLEGADSLIMLTATHYGAEVSRSRQNSLLTNEDGHEPSALSFKLNALPSWVPDWRHRAHHLFGSPDTPHRAAGETKPQLTIDKSTMRLHIKGMHMDTIEIVSWVIRGDSFHVRGQREAATHPIVALWQRVCRQKPPIHLSASSLTGSRYYPTGEPPFLALAQCLTNAGVGMSRLRDHATIPASEHLANAAAYLGRTARPSDPMVSEQVRELGRDGGGDAFKWSHEASLISRHRRLGLSAQGHFVLGPDSMEPGDAVVVLYGGTVPYALRRRGQRSEDGWILIGECYVHGMMNGEALAMKGAVEETFTIH